MIVDFNYFSCKVEVFPFQNLTKNSWDYKTRAQELTSGAIGMFLPSFVKIWEHFKDEAHGGKIAASISVVVFWSIRWNLWGNERFFSAL